VASPAIRGARPESARGESWSPGKSALRRGVRRRVGSLNREGCAFEEQDTNGVVGKTLSFHTVFADRPGLYAVSEVFFCYTLPRYRMIELLSHECVHAAQWIVDKRAGSIIKGRKHEAQAYLASGLLIVALQWVDNIEDPDHPDMYPNHTWKDD